jgi:hypothetical protein
MCRASCKKTYKCVTRQQRMGEQSRLSTWPDVNVLNVTAKYRTSSVTATVTHTLLPVGAYELPLAFYACLPVRVRECVLI